MSMYERFTFRGKTLDRQTIGALMAVEKILGYEQTIIQGSYSSGVSASSGTHDGGGAIDVVWVDVKRKTRAHRKVGWAFWPRTALPGVWSRHCHGILLGNDRASAGAKVQMIEYRNGQDGLAGSGRDPFWRPKKIRAFSYHDAGLVSWKRLNAVAKLPGGRPLHPGAARQVEVVARALRGFGMDFPAHKKGRMDKPILEALERFRKIRRVDDTAVDAPLNPQTCYELCIPTREGRAK